MLHFAGLLQNIIDIFFTLGGAIVILIPACFMYALERRVLGSRRFKGARQRYEAMRHLDAGRFGKAFYQTAYALLVATCYLVLLPRATGKDFSDTLYDLVFPFKDFYSLQEQLQAAGLENKVGTVVNVSAGAMITLEMVLSMFSEAIVFLPLGVVTYFWANNRSGIAEKVSGLASYLLVQAVCCSAAKMLNPYVYVALQDVIKVMLAISGAGRPIQFNLITILGGIIFLMISGYAIYRLVKSMLVKGVTVSALAFSMAAFILEPRFTVAANIAFMALMALSAYAISLIYNRVLYHGGELTYGFISILGIGALAFAGCSVLAAAFIWIFR